MAVAQDEIILAVCYYSPLLEPWHCNLASATPSRPIRIFIDSKMATAQQIEAMQLEMAQALKASFQSARAALARKSV